MTILYYQFVFPVRHHLLLRRSDTFARAVWDYYAVAVWDYYAVALRIYGVGTCDISVTDV